jgi:hypothetical protein
VHDIGVEHFVSMFERHGFVRRLATPRTLEHARYIATPPGENGSSSSC